MEKQLGVLTLIGAMVCGFWFWSLYPPAVNDVAWVQLVLSPTIGVFLLAWSALLLKTPMVLRRFALYVFSLE